MFNVGNFNCIFLENSGIKWDICKYVDRYLK